VGLYFYSAISPIPNEVFIMALIAQDQQGGGLSVLGGGDSSGGLLGTVIAASLLGGRGLGIGNDCGRSTLNCATTDDVNAAAQASTLARIEASIPYNEAQVQLALAGTTTAIQATANTNAQILLASQNAIARDAATNSALLTRDIAGVATDVARESCAIQHAVCEDGNATRALITTGVIDRLRDDKLILANELAELRSERNRDRDRHGIEITTIVNQNQLQAQFQQQRQDMDTFRCMMNDMLQGIRTTSQAINIGAGTQTANPLNTSTNNNVRA
jgi:hypothetical protein